MYDRLCGLVVRAPSYRTRAPGLFPRHYQIFWEVVGMERGPLRLLSTIEEILGRKSSGSGLENRDYGRRNASLCPRDILYPQKLALTSLASGCRSVDIVRSWTQATELYTERIHVTHTKHFSALFVRKFCLFPNVITTQYYVRYVPT
jgi:hypothetical protein